MPGKPQQMIKKYKGELIKETGDGVLVRFTTK